MIELFNEALSFHNLPVTVLLVLVLLYWLLVVVGLADSDMDGVDLNHDGIPDFSDHAGTNGGFLHSIGKALHLGNVPLMIVLSVLSLSMWVISILANYYYNGEPGNRSDALALMYLVPNFLVSLAITRIFLAPFKAIFVALQKREAEATPLVGQQATVISTQVDASYGQIEITTNGSPVLLNARVAADQPAIVKGTTVLIYESAPDDAYHFIRPINQADSASE